MARGAWDAGGVSAPSSSGASGRPSFEQIFSSALAEANATVDAARRAVALQTLPTKLTHKTLSEAITTALEDVKAYHLAAECERFGLAPQSPREPDPMSGKARYITRRLRPLSLEQAVEVARRVNEDYEHLHLTHLLKLAQHSGVAGELKNLIFAANGPKPTIVLADAVNNTIQITANAQYCLVYDRPVPETGLSWRALTAWWADTEVFEDQEAERTAGRSLYRRLQESMAGNEAELLLFGEYGKLYGAHGFGIPALIPQVYLHYDPYTHRTGVSLVRQRMDFFMLLPGRRRIVLEVDGVQHYADGHRRASPRLYAQMVAEDRKLRLAGYEVYRFGGQEFVDRAQATAMLQEFFTTLLDL